MDPTSASIVVHTREPKPPQCSLAQFADIHGLTLVVRQRPDWVSCARYYAMFKDTWVMQHGVRHGVFGNGDSIEQAITEYAKEISGKSLMIDPPGELHRILNVPDFTPKEPKKPK